MNTDFSRTRTLEQALFERMGVSVDDAVATGTDFVDETVSRAVASGVDVDARISALAELLEKLTRPETMASVQSLIDQLPQLARLAQLANEFPKLLATAGDFLDEQQLHMAEQGIDVEKALTGSAKTVMQIGTWIDPQSINATTVGLVDKVARSMNAALNETQRSEPKRIGLFGLMRVLRDPAFQKSLAFAIEFGKSFGRNLGESAKDRPDPPR
jgi:uncharacterized protein YjgD (DUF1641 family)